MCHSSAATSSWRWRWRSSSACWSSSRTASSAALRSEMYKQLQHGVRSAPPPYWLRLFFILFFFSPPALALPVLGVVPPTLLKRPAGLPGGVQGPLLPPPDPPQLAKDAFASVTGGTAMTSDQWMYYLSLVSALVLFWVAWNLIRRRPGRALRALRDREVAAASYGINIAGYKTMAFGISAFYAGIGGALYGLAIGFVSPDTFPLALSFQLLVGTVVGGLASIAGPLIGGVFTFWLPIVSSQFVGSQPWIPAQIASVFQKAGPAVTYGALLIVIMIFAPNGIVGLVRAGYMQ